MHIYCMYIQIAFSSYIYIYISYNANISTWCAKQHCASLMCIYNASVLSSYDTGSSSMPISSFKASTSPGMCSMIVPNISRNYSHFPLFKKIFQAEARWILRTNFRRMRHSLHILSYSVSIFFRCSTGIGAVPDLSSSNRALYAAFWIRK